MSQATVRDPFAVFGLAPELDLDVAQLERKYLKLSRDVHPDRHRNAAGDCVAVLQRAATLNDAFAVLRDPWERARVLLELRQPGVLDATKTLDPDFLMTALEEAETVAQAADAELPALRARVERTADASFRAIAQALARDDVAGAARAFHEARYHRKALADLDARIHGDERP